MMDALGLIENRSFLASVVAADTALKAANVMLKDMEIIRGGYVNVKLVGDVAAVQAAVAAARDAVESYGTLISSHVIPRMHAETWQLVATVEKMDETENAQLVTDSAAPEEVAAKLEPALSEENEEGSRIEVEQALKEIPVPSATEPSVGFSEEELATRTVRELREQAEKLGLLEESTKYVRKAELIRLLLEQRLKSDFQES